jgi:RNA polymerase sigma-54 factor
MDESLRISQDERLQQRLNPQQVIFGRLLEMTAPEVEDEVRRVLDENPALEEREHVDSDDDIHNEDDDFSESAEELQRADYRDEDDIPDYRTHVNNTSKDDDYFEPIAIEEGHSMFDELTAQLADFDLTQKQANIATYIIGNLDSNGYTTRSLQAIADDITISAGIDTSVDEVKEVNKIIRQLDPAGIGAVDLRDCLLLQIDRLPNSLTVKIAHEIIANYFDVFTKAHFDKLKAHLSIDEDALRDALNLIKSLNPKPGALLEQTVGEDKLRHIVPDFSVEVNSDGTISVSLLSKTPELAIEQTFAIDTTAKPSSKNKREHDAMTFIKRKHDEAAAFIRMLSMRAETLLAVMRSIATRQVEFFTNFNQASIRPMILKDVGSDTGLDLSVISRATTGKYVITSNGIYPLKMFFNERPKDDTDTSSHEINEAIRELIKAEDKRHPLSDEAIKEALTAKGYDIARRTVAKYREKIGFPVARLRKHI